MIDFNPLINTCYVLTNGSIRSLAYYSHLIPIFFILPLSILVILKSKKDILSKIFLAFSVVFSIWLILDLVTWVSSNYFLVYSFWAPIDYVEILFYLLGVYFIIVFNKNKDIKIVYKILIFSLAVIPAVLTFLQKSLLGFDHSVCEALNNNFLLNYRFYLELISLIFILFYTLIAFIKDRSILEKKSHIFINLSMFVFLLIFSLSTYLATTTAFYEINLYALFATPIFLLFITYSIFNLDIFNSKLISTYFIVFGFVILMAVQLLFVSSGTDRILTIFTVIISSSLIYILFKNLKKESDQLKKIQELSERLESSKMRLEKTNIDLGEANEKLKGLDKLKTEFLSLASHQLRSPLTAIKGYASMLQEGDYGEVTEEAKDTINRIYLSSQSLTKVVEDLLDVSKIEQGGMKYEMASFDIADLAEEMVKDLSISAEKKGLKLEFNKNSENKYIVNGDKEKIRQVILNLIDNSIKYTKIGGINVLVKKNDGKIIISIKDTGMGISKDMSVNLFAKFERGEGAKENTSGSGLGLYLAKQIITAHKGQIWGESEGVGKGSTFFIELDELR